MSSFKCKGKSEQHEPLSKSDSFNGSSNRNIPGLLRLDSIGEVSSAYNVTKCQDPTLKHDGLNSKNNRHCQTSYKNLVGNLSMGSFLNSAGAYFGSASTYIGNLCPYKTSKGLTRSHSDTSTLGYINHIFKGVSQPQPNRAMSVPMLEEETLCLPQSCKCSRAKKSMNWTGNIFGAIQSSFLSNCSAKSDKMKGVNVEKYVPPQRRYNQEKFSNISSVCDPKLTPYNAKLLEKSKQNQSKSHPTDKRNNGNKSYQKEALKTNGVILYEHNVIQGCEKKSNPCSTSQETILKCKHDTVVSPQTDSQTVILNDITETADSCESGTDWFNYECENAKCIPVSIEKVQLASDSKKCAKSAQIPDSSNTHQLHSWCSIENGYDMENTESSPTEDAANLCDITETSRVEEHGNQSAEERIIKEKSLDINESLQDKKELAQGKCEAKSEEKNESNHLEADNNYVLYVRNLGRRGRPSKKKRRRQKAQQNENIGKPEAHCDKSQLVINPNPPKSACHAKSAVALILGYGSDSSVNDAHSFHVSCDIGDDSDWSDSDFESDENYSSLEDEAAFGNGLGFQCNDPLSISNMQCFTVTCSVQPPEDSSLSSDSSAIDDINLSWRVQVSVDPEKRKKKSSTSKKVRFADSADLATVHPMIAWSHAYQAARKGPWEQFARDRGRFLRKITDGETLLKPVLVKAHRDRIFRERFSKD